jgi:hypothetical protein
LTIYALGASPEIMEKQYANNAKMQRPVVLFEKKTVEDMSDPDNFKKYLGNGNYYHDYLVFFQGELEKKGVDGTLNEYIFAGDARADDMLIRMFAGKSLVVLSRTTLII